MSERGVFAVDRGIWDHDLLTDSEPFSRREAWLWLISEAAWKSHRRRIIGRQIELTRGQLVASTRFIASKWRWSEARVRRFLSALISEEMIDAKTDAGVSVITICKYDEYQRVSLPTDAMRKDDVDAGATQERRKVEDREYKEIDSEANASECSAPELALTIPRKTKANPKRTRAKPRVSLPDDWRLPDADRAHAHGRGFDPPKIDAMATAFANHHRARGNLMADWSAAWRTWCDNEIKFDRSGNNGQRGPRAFQDDRLSVTKAIERRLVDAEAGQLRFPPRPRLLPEEREDDRRLLPPGRSP